VTDRTLNLTMLLFLICFFLVGIGFILAHAPVH